MNISFGELPDQPNLFLDYVYEFENVNKYFDKNFRDIDQYEKYFNRIIEFNKSKNFKIEEVIASQFSNQPINEKVKANIELLSQDNTLAVVTGQQLGLMGGPLYTFYKAATAIKLAEEMSIKYPSYNFVPIFWLEGEDHDFDEVAYTAFINKSGEYKALSYTDDSRNENTTTSVGDIKFKESIKLFVENFIYELRDSEFKQGIENQLKQIYKEDRTFKDAFKDILNIFFNKHGLILFDASLPEVKQFLIPIFEQEISEYRNTTNKLIEVSAELDNTYHAQVKIKPINLFYKLDGDRYSIEPGDEGEFKLKNKRRKFSYAEIVKEIELNPGAFTPNVLLRPICQDYLLPTAFYIAGPGEVSYFAQVNTLYKIFNVEQPIIYPRFSATILEKNIPQFLEKYNINLVEMFIDIEGLRNRIVSSISNVNLEDFFKQIEYEENLLIDRIKEKLFEIDKTISEAGEKYRQKIVSYLSEYKKKSIDAQNKRYDIVLRQLDKVLLSIYPNSNLQEREFSIFYYMVKYGPDFADWLFDEVELFNFEHKFIIL